MSILASSHGAHSLVVPSADAAAASRCLFFQGYPYHVVRRGETYSLEPCSMGSGRPHTFEEDLYLDDIPLDRVPKEVRTIVEDLLAQRDEADD